GWIFFGIGFSQGLVSFALQYGTYVLVTDPGVLPGGELMSWLGQIAWFPGLNLMLTYAVLLFPSGHLPSPRWRIFAWICVIPVLLFIPVTISVWPYRGLVLLLHPDQVTPTSGFLTTLMTLSFPMLLLCGLVSLVSIFIRFHKADLLERRQIKWIAFAASLFMAMELLQTIEPVYAFFNDNKLTYLVAIPVSIALPAAVGIAVLRYRLWEIDILINRTLVYVPLTAILSGLYAASISLLQKMFIATTGAKSDGAVVLTTLILTATFTPIKGAIQSFVDRRFKNPVEPQAALKAFKSQVQTVEEVVNKESALRRFLEDSVSALQASCGAVSLSNGGVPQVVSVNGDWTAGRETLTIPIGQETGSIGTLFLGPRRDGTAYTQAEISLLTGVAGSLWRVLGMSAA
ncbi:hypothetical protein MUO71_02745, partial [Candidatus Bathyarchaeota archaeon]|nr:hypothetical protein [Candidatus Bathyarchaeota archaeon]